MSNICTRISKYLEIIITTAYSNVELTIFIKCTGELE